METIALALVSYQLQELGYLDDKISAIIEVELYCQVHIGVWVMSALIFFNAVIAFGNDSFCFICEEDNTICVHSQPVAGV